MRWLLIFLLAFLLFNGLQHWLRKIGLGRLPGDIRFRAGGRDWYLPFTSSVILSVLVMLLGLVL
jgi:hypothetical protein